MNNVKSLESIKLELDKYIDGQDEAKKVLSILAHNYMMTHNTNTLASVLDSPRLMGMFIVDKAIKKLDL